MTGPRGPHQEPSDVLRFSGARFPVQSAEGRPKSVPWAMVAEHEAQAIKNHQQTLARLAERGGLGVDELWCVIHDQPFEHRPRPEWCDAWLSGVNDLRVALVQAVHAERIAREPVGVVEPQYDGPPTVRALNRVADRVEAALRELLPHTFADLCVRGADLVRLLREEAENEMEERWPK